MADYTGWTNYETWAVNLWIGNDEGSHHYWDETTRTIWETVTSQARLDTPFTASEQARLDLAETLKDDLEENLPADIDQAVHGTMYADLLNAALDRVEWMEIADGLLEACELDGYEPRTRESTGRYWEPVR